MLKKTHEEDQSPTLVTSKMPRSSKTVLHHYLQAATSDNTRRTYRSAIKQFEKWGGRLPTDRETVVCYLLDRAKSLNPRTLDLHLTAISQWHYVQGINDPVHDPLVGKTMDGIRRIHGQPKRKAKALSLDDLTKMLTHLEQLPHKAKRLRDIALLLIGFFGAFRRSELVAIQVADLSWESEGLLIKLPRSKTDQSGHGLTRALPYGESSFSIKGMDRNIGNKGRPYFSSYKSMGSNTVHTAQRWRC